jgi:hypothetical protein
VWLDPALNWKEHIAQATRKGLTASEALTCLATSTWGPSARHTRPLYTAVVRPTLLYGSPEWSTQTNGKPLAVSTLAPLQSAQNTYLRTITGGYRRTPKAALEREARVMPIDLYMEVTKGQRQVKTQEHQVEVRIKHAADTVWRRIQRA